MNTKIITEDILWRYRHITVLNVSIYGSVMEYNIGLNVLPRDIDICVVVSNEVQLTIRHDRFTHNGMEVEVEFMNEDEFIEELRGVVPKFLLCTFSDIKYIDYLMNASRRTVRDSISRVCNRAYHKGLKILSQQDVTQEHLGLKNIWHSIKFIYFAFWFYDNSTMMVENALEDVKKMNELRVMMLTFYNETRDEKALDKYMRPCHNSALTKFRNIFPKG